MILKNIGKINNLEVDFPVFKHDSKKWSAPKISNFTKQLKINIENEINQNNKKLEKQYLERKYKKNNTKKKFLNKRILNEIDKLALLIKKSKVRNKKKVNRKNKVKDFMNKSFLYFNESK